MGRIPFEPHKTAILEGMEGRGRGQILGSGRSQSKEHFSQYTIPLTCFLKKKVGVPKSIFPIYKGAGQNFSPPTFFGSTHSTTSPYTPTRSDFTLNHYSEKLIFRVGRGRGQNFLLPFFSAPQYQQLLPIYQYPKMCWYMFYNA